VEVTRQGDGRSLAEQPYDKRRLSYSNTFPDFWSKLLIRVMEWCTGKWALLRRIRKFERIGAPHGQGFWTLSMEVMGIDVRTPPSQIDNIPATGPVIIVANHPHGLVDGMVLGEVIGRKRTDYKILTRSLLTGVQEIDHFMIPVPFPHEDDALQKNLEMRKEAMTHLKDGGVIVLFPSGVVASSDTMFGPAIEREWNPFTAKMIQRSGATVVPIFFPGANSRWYQIANRISAPLRQGLLIHEVVHALDKPQAPVVGPAFDADEIKEWGKNPRGFMAWLREQTLALKDYKG
jgi:putative hemolysin